MVIYCTENAYIFNHINISRCHIKVTPHFKLIKYFRIVVLALYHNNKRYWLIADICHGNNINVTP